MELALVFDLMDSVEKAGHRRAVEGRCKADTPDSGGGGFTYGKRFSFDSHHEVDRLRHGLTDRLYHSKVRKTGSEEHIGPSFFEGLEAADRVLEARVGIEEVMGPCRHKEGKLE